MSDTANVENIDRTIQELVVERLKTMPSGLKLSIGSEGNYSRDELIDRVLKGDDLGKKIIQIQLHYLQAMKSGELLLDD